MTSSSSRVGEQPQRNHTRRRARDRKTKPRPAWEPQAYSPTESSRRPAPDDACDDTGSIANRPASTAARLEAAAQREVALDAKAERLRQFERTLQRRESAVCQREQDAEVAAAKLEEIAREIAMREQQMLATSRSAPTQQRATGRHCSDDRVEVINRAGRRAQAGGVSRDQDCENSGKRRLIASSGPADRDVDCKRRQRVAGASTPTKSATQLSSGANPVGAAFSEAQRSWRP